MASDMAGSGSGQRVTEYPGTCWTRVVSGLSLSFLAAILSCLAHPASMAAAESSGASTSGERKVRGSFIHFFDQPHDPDNWFKTDFSYPGPHPAWKSKLIRFEIDRVDLVLKRQLFGRKRYQGAEYQRLGFYHYGRYEVVMRAAPGSGTVSAMFTHTQKQFGDPHDEIDIEFLGKDLRYLHANYFTDGRSYGSHYIPLGFDASREVHLYAFEWEPDEIRWYVDGQLKHTARHSDHPIPQSPGRIMIQLWTGSRLQHDWHGPPTFANGTRASFYCLSYRQTGDLAPQCSDTFDPEAANAPD